MALFIGIDSGTQGTKAVVLDSDERRVVARARHPHRSIEGLPAGHWEQDPAEWIGALDAVLAEVGEKIDRSRVRGIGVGAQQHGFVPLDAEGKAIRPAKLWCDTSTVAECAFLTRKLGGPAAVLRRTGLPFLPGYTAPKILWLKRHEPAHYRRLRRVLLPHDFLNHYLTGGFSMEYGDASGTALLDVRRRIWSREAVAAIDPGLAECLPPLRPSHEAAGVLRPELARRHGLPPAVVGAGGGDNMMGAIGTGAVVPGVVTASVGTSGTIYAWSGRPVVDPSGEIAAFCASSGGWLPLLCTMNATAVTERVRGLFGYDHAALDAAVSSVPAGAGGLTLLPYLAGERTPNLPDAKGVLFGLDHRTMAGPAIARAAMEGVALGMNYGLERLRALGVTPREIRLTGGGVRSPVWRQIMADVFGVPVVPMVEEEGAALGAALQALWCVSLREEPRTRIGDLAKSFVATDEAARCRPVRANRAAYAGRQKLHDRLGAALRPLFLKNG